MWNPPSMQNDNISLTKDVSPFFNYHGPLFFNIIFTSALCPSDPTLHKQLNTVCAWTGVAISAPPSLLIALRHLNW